MSNVRTLRRGEAVALETLSGSGFLPHDVVIGVRTADGVPDVVALLLGVDGRVRDDRDLVFFNQPESVDGAVSVDPAAATARVRTAAVASGVERVLVALAGGALEHGAASTVRVDVTRPDGGPLATAVVDVPAGHRAESLVEVYRRSGSWRLRLLGEGYAGGLAALVRDHGVTVDDTPPAPADVPPPAAPPEVVPPLVAPRAVAPRVVAPSVVAPTVVTPVWPTTTARPPAPAPAPAPPTSRPPRGRRRPLLIGGGVAAVLLLGIGIGTAVSGGDPATGPTLAAPVAATTSTSPSPSPSASPTVLPAADAVPVQPAATAQAQLATLVVKGRAPMTGYDRSQFGQEWADVDRNGCDTRNDVLRRDVTDPVIDPATHGCVVLSGQVADPYSGRTIPFVRGAATSADLQVDHVVALGDAWQTGAQQLDATRREQFANDPANLRVVDGALNAQKGDGDAATWLPPNVAFRCRYVAQQVAVKQTYGLWVTPAEHDAIAAILAGCPGATAPPAPTTAPPPTTSAPAPAASAPVVVPAPATTAAAPPPAADPGSVYYPNCDAVRAAGKAPLLAGEPGYNRKLDRDGDGVACE